MKSKTSFFNKTIFKKNITHFWPIWLIILAWNMFIMPFMIYNVSLSYKMVDYMTEQEIARQKANDVLSIVSVYANPIVLFIFSVVAVMAVFSYLYNSRSANTIHALPVTRGSLFITNYISGLLFLLVPEIIGFLTGILVSALCGFTSVDHLLTGLLFAGGISFVFYSFTVFIAMFTGQLLAVPIFSVIINFLYVGCKGLISLIMSLISYGMPLDFHRGRMDALSPLYYIASHVSLKYEYINEYSFCTGLTGGEIVAVYAVAAVFFITAAYLIYRIRDMETAGSLISIEWICPIFRWGAAFCGGSLLSVMFCSIISFQSGSMVFISFLIGSVVFGICSFFGAQMFLEKGFRVFKKRRILECGAFVGVFAFLIIGIEWDLFGQERKIPETEDIEAAYIQVYSSLGGSDETMIDQVLNLHKQMIESKKEFEDYQWSSQDTYFLEVRYHLKNESVLRRQYGVPVSAELLTDETTVIHKVATLNAQPEVYAKELFGDDYDTVEPRNGDISLYDRDSEEWHQKEFSKEEAEIIYQGVMEDIKAGNFKDYIMSRYDYNEYNQDAAYDNSINIEYFSKTENRFADVEFHSDERAVSIRDTTGYANIGFDANCKNTIAALIKSGVIKSEKDLTRMEESENLTED